MNLYEDHFDLLFVLKHLFKEFEKVDYNPIMILEGHILEGYVKLQWVMNGKKFQVCKNLSKKDSQQYHMEHWHK